MSLPQGFARIEDAVLTTTSAPEVLYDGLGALNTGAMCTTSDAPAFWPNGIPVTADGYVCITASPTLPVYYSNGMRFDATGRLVISTYAGSPSFSNAGLVFDADGNLVTINYGIYWPFAAYADANDGALVGPWNDLTRTGLGTRIGPTGLVEYGQHNLIQRSDDVSNAIWSKAQGATTPDAETVVFAALSESRVEQSGAALQLTQIGQSATVQVEMRADTPLSVNLSAGGDRVYTTVSVTTEWQRFTATRTRTGAGTENVFAIIANVGSAAGAVKVRKIGINLGSTANEFIPTTTTARYLPRIGYDPVTLASEGLLIEGAGTNLAPASGNASNAVWSKARCSAVANAATAPDGTLTASEIVEDTSTNTHEVTGVSITLAANTQITAQIRVKRGAGTRNFRFTLYAGSDGLRVNADLGALAITNGSYGSSVFTSASITGPDVNGYYTVTCTGIHSTISASPVISWQLLNAANAGFYAGDGVSSLVFGGIQIETGAVATSYIPNPGTGTAVRVADDWFLSGGALDAAIDPAANTLVFDFNYIPGVEIGGVFSLNDGGPTNRIDFRCADGQVYVRKAGVGTTIPTDGVLTGANKLAVSYGAAGVSVSLNGATTVVLSGDYSYTSFTRLYIGALEGGILQLNSTIKSARSIKGQYITGAALQALTS